jgi:hypothetical protein
MERTFLETVHFLGLDLELALVAVLAAFEGLLRLAENLRTERKTRSSQVEQSPRPAAWPPAAWRTNH